jgi:multiple antibiotic resistance protein
LSQQAFYPMTMPLTVGPGSISVALTLGANPTARLSAPCSQPPWRTRWASCSWPSSVYLCYRYADRILRRLGPTGTSVVVRLSAFILLCIGVQIGWNGVRGLIASGFPSSIS